MKDNKRSAKGQFIKGNPGGPGGPGEQLLPQEAKRLKARPHSITHGGYSFIRTGRLPKRKKAIRKYLMWVRKEYAIDIAGEEEMLTAGQTVLLNKLVMLEGLCRCIEMDAVDAANEACRLPVMPAEYLPYVNSIVKVCKLLGIERRVVPQDAHDLGKYLDTHYPDKGEEATDGKGTD